MVDLQQLFNSVCKLPAGGDDVVEVLSIVQRWMIIERR
jgi:hypothetical protein